MKAILQPNEPLTGRSAPSNSASLPPSALRRSMLTLMVAVFGMATVVSTAAAGAQAVTLVPNQNKAAGTGSGSYNGDFGSANFVSLNTPSAMAFDSAGNLFITDKGNNCVRRVDAVTGSVTTAVGLATGGAGDSCNAAANPSPTPAQGLFQPSGIAIDFTDTLYIADTGHNCVRALGSRASGTSSLVTVAGTCTAINTSGGTTPGSSTPRPVALAIDTTNGLDISLQDTANGIFQVVRHVFGDPSTTLCRVAGAASAAIPSNCPGIANSVVLSSPEGIAFDPTGALYLADTGNNCVRTVQGGNLSTTVGTCANDGTASGTAAIVNPRELLFNRQGEMYLTEGTANQLLRFNAATKLLTRIAGDPSGAAGTYDATQNGAGAQSVPLHTPLGLAFDSGGNLYLADSDNSVVRSFRSSANYGSVPIGSGSSPQLVTFTINNATLNLTVASGPDYTIDASTCNGTLAGAPAGSLSKFCTVTVSFHPTLPGLRASALRLTDSLSGSSVTADMQGTGLSSQPVFAPGTALTAATAIANPIAITVDSAGSAYVLNAGTAPGLANVTVITSSGAVTSNAIPAAANLVNPVAITSDAGGSFYLADATTGKIAKFGSDGSVNASYVSGLTAPSAIALDIDGNLVIAEGGSKHDLVKHFVGGQTIVLTGAGTDTAANNVPATNAMLQSPAGLKIGPGGNIFFSDSAAHRVYAIDTSGLIHFLAGNGTTTTSGAGTALGTGLVQPTGVDLDAAGDVFITDPPANMVYVVYSSTLQILNLAPLLGTGTAGNSGDAGLATLAAVNGPLAVATANSGAIYVVDAGNKSVRSVTFPIPTIDFGDVALNGTVSKAQQLWNRGNLNFIRTFDPVIGDPHFTNDAALTTCGQSVGLGATCNFGFSFTPTVKGLANANGQLLDVAYNSPQTVNFKANGVAAAITITAGAETEVYGAAYLGTVTIAGNGGPTPTGTITFSVNGIVLCTLTGNLSGNLQCVNNAGSNLNVGAYPVTITYSGDGNYPQRTLTTTLTVTPAPLTVVVDNKIKTAGTPNPVLTGTLSGLVAGQTATAVFSTTATTNSPAGSYPITATVVFGAGTLVTNYSVTVTPGTLTVYTPTSITLATSLNPSTQGQSVTFTAKVTAPTGIPVGSITFYDGTTSLGSVPADATGTATLATSQLALGVHTITASFSPTTQAFLSASTSLTQTVSLPLGGFVVIATPITYLVRGKGSVVYTATVTANGGFYGPVALTCKGLPADATCVFDSPTVTIGPGAPATTNFTVGVTLADATATLALPIRPGMAPVRPGMTRRAASSIYAAAVFPMELSGLGAFLFGAVRRRRVLRRSLFVILLGFGLLGLSGCGCPNSSFKTYAVTVTGTSVNGGLATSSAVVAITVATPAN